MFRRRGGYRRVSATTAASNAEASEDYRERTGPERSRYASEISSSISLQILIYYNGLSSVVFFVLEGGLITEKLYNFKFESELQRQVLAPIFISWAITEVHRLYFGFIGNIKEMVPHMCAFLLTTIFPQMFCLVFFAFFQEHRFPVDSMIGSMQLGFLAFEAVFGYSGIKAIVNKRTAQFFRVAQEEFLTRREGEEHERLL